LVRKVIVVDYKDLVSDDAATRRRIWEDHIRAVERHRLFYKRLANGLALLGLIPIGSALLVYMLIMLFLLVG
jgi:hypothetical protein